MSTVNGQTRATVGSLVALVALIGGIASIFLPMKDRVDSLQDRLVTLEGKVDRIQLSRFSYEDGQALEARWQTSLSHHEADVGHTEMQDRMTEVKVQLGRLEERITSLEKK